MKEIQRLDKLISNFGYGSRKEVKQLLKEGAVRVDGAVVKDGSLHVDPKASTVYVGGSLLAYREYVYIMMNKPAGVISATFDKKLPTVAGLLPEEYKCFDLFPAGRLDIDTEGLLILTNDGALAHEILSPRKHVPKRYYALVEGAVNSDDVSRFSEGVVLDDGYKTMPAELEIIRSGLRSEIELVLREGKFHQVKRMFEAVGKRVIFLKRIGMGALRLDESLAPGGSRELSAGEVTLLGTRTSTE